MTWDDHNKETLLSIAQEHGLKVDSNTNKPEIIKALKDANVGEPGTHEVSGVQPARVVPRIPMTHADFRKMQINPDLPPEQQSAPPQELLNPHLFPSD